MKLYSILFPLFLCLLTQAQGVKNYSVKLDFINKDLLLTVTPFKSLIKNKYCQILISDTTILLRNTNIKDTTIKNKGLYKHFRILNKSEDNLRFLILSKEYDKYSLLGINTGYNFMYFIDMRDRKMKLYVYDFFKNNMSKREVAIVFEKIPVKPLLIKGNIK